MINIDKSLKIFISTHKDFTPNVKGDEYTIICNKGDLNNTYDIPVIEEDWEGKYIDMHMSYAELTRLFYIYKNIMYLPDYVGFCQYKRIFNLGENPTQKLNEILKEHDAIVSPIVFQCPNIKYAYGSYHNSDDINAAEEIVKQKFPHFVPAMEKVFNDTHLHPHNTFIMSRKDFRDYCYFLMTILEQLDRNNNWNSMDDMKRDKRQIKTHGFLAERIGAVFFEERFKNPVELPFL